MLSWWEWWEECKEQKRVAHRSNDNGDEDSDDDGGLDDEVLPLGSGEVHDLLAVDHGLAQLTLELYSSQI
jgi:hypothetical protein